MTGVQVGTAKYTVLKVLFDEATSGRPDPSITVMTVSDRLGRRLSSAICLIHLDELAAEGLVMSPKRGVRTRFQITGNGINLVDELIANKPVEVSAVRSETWTGLYQPSHAQHVKIRKALVGIKDEIASLNLSNTERSNALSLVAAAEALIEAPDPEWALIVSIFSLPVLANLTALAALIVTSVKG